LIHREDPDVSEGVEQLFRDEGIDIFTNFLITKVEGKSGQSVKAYLKRNGSDVIVEATHILVASGRTPNTKDLGLDSTGVEVDGRGYVKVNERLETTTPGIWAAGDCAGSPHFTHISENDFHVIHDNMLGGHRTTVGRQVPFCMFTDPELARVGLSETEAKARGVQYRVAKIPMSAIFRAKTLSETRGFLKVLIEAEGDQILGFTGFGWDAGEMMAAVQVAMIGKMPYTTLRDVIFTHPTMAEGLISLLAKVPAIGKPNK
jgi:pyruvate/2-oxoglutarate dehydrogenase complex dihydrolipoamide dehydrogenase (E3) component